MGGRTPSCAPISDQPVEREQVIEGITEADLGLVHDLLVIVVAKEEVEVDRPRGSPRRRHLRQCGRGERAVQIPAFQGAEVREGDIHHSAPIT
ncbi:MAG: hypothetical protein QM767_11085 [Anaeromyxobacter sp.]